MDLINKNIGEKIKSRRLRLGYSQLMLSELAHVSRDQISRIESGKINFTLATLFKICRALRIKPHKLLKDAEQEEYIKSGDLRPFVKWAGGKTQILDELMQRIPNEFNNYFEPFVGGGTTCFVAKKLQRQYIGIELEEEYFSIAKRRIDSIKANT
ncbi:MAG: helix-turn-helix domain-containing protein [Bacilli bacterium]